MLQITVNRLGNSWEATALLVDGTEIYERGGTMREAINLVLDKIAEEAVVAATENTRFVLAT